MANFSKRIVGEMRESLAIFNELATAIMHARMAISATLDNLKYAEQSEDTPILKPKKRGRPHGSKNKPKELMSIPQFVRRTNMPRSSVYYHIKNGKFKVVMMGKRKYLRTAEVENYLKGKK